MQIYLVGGAVRDKLLNLPVKERDWVVVGARAETLLRMGYQPVGRDFPVFLHPQTKEEYALARLERKIAPGYSGFSFDAAPTVTLEEDLMRRDLTINAMAETADGQLIDPFGGAIDLENRLLRHVSAAFAEDPVRILRVGRFAARFAYLGFKVAPATQQLMRHMVEIGEVAALVAERVWKELERALAEAHPTEFFFVLAACGALPVLFPLKIMQAESIAALQAAVSQSGEPLIRFAALLHLLNDVELAALCQRYRIPTAYRDLARLVARHLNAYQHALTLSAAAMLALLQALDVFRRPQRFEQWLLACGACVAGEAAPIAAHLRGCVRAAHTVDAAAIAQHYSGQAIAAQIRAARLERIAGFLMD